MNKVRISWAFCAFFLFAVFVGIGTQCRNMAIIYCGDFFLLLSVFFAGWRLKNYMEEEI